MFRPITIEIGGFCSLLPHNFCLEIILSEDLVKKNLYIMSYMIVKMDIYRSVFTHD